MTFCGLWGDWYKNIKFNLPHHRYGALIFDQEDTATLHVIGAHVARVEAHDHVGFCLPHRVNTARGSIGPVSEHYLPWPELMAAKSFSPGIVRQFHCAESSRGRINLNMRSPLHSLVPWAVDHGRINYANGPSAHSLRYLVPKHSSQYMLQPTLRFAQTIK